LKLDFSFFNYKKFCGGWGGWLCLQSHKYNGIC